MWRGVLRKTDGIEERWVASEDILKRLDQEHDLMFMDSNGLDEKVMSFFEIMCIMGYIPISKKGLSGKVNWAFHGLPSRIWRPGRHMLQCCRWKH
jgi:hypothetical protein